MKEGLNYVLSQLDERKRSMLYMRYAEYKTYEQIGESFGITTNRARDIIARALRQLRHPSKIRYVLHGLYYYKTLQEEERQREERYKNIQKNKTEGVLLSDMEEISVRTYNCLYRKGFNFLNEVNKFIKVKGPEWYREIPNLGVKSKDEVEKAIELYGLNSEEVNDSEKQT